MWTFRLLSKNHGKHGNAHSGDTEIVNLQSQLCQLRTTAAFFAILCDEEGRKAGVTETRRKCFATYEKTMATSSITANIEIKDPAAARAFVDALLSTEPWPQPKPTVCASYFASDDEAHSFFRRSPYAQKVGVR